ncbi:MAG: signal recognition particle-docking protein FtsY [Desulfobacterales bacterium]|nr:signal recognition particle-docking protein FtsY [Desulfobacterales bacterium]
MVFNRLKKNKDNHTLLKQKTKAKAVDQAGSIGFFKRLKQGLAKTREILTTDIDQLFTGNRKVDANLLEELEEILITSDIGVRASMDIIESIAKKTAKISGPDQLKYALREEIFSILNTHSPPPSSGEITSRPHVIMVIGVNGVGKTTTIGKLAAKYAAEGKSVLIIAADTFRAAAIEQLSIWADRAGAEIVKHRDNSDPAAVAYDGIEAAIARGVDIVLVDTAGRLHTKINLMEELKKIKRTISKKLPDAPHEILLVLDATTGQNALSQAKVFNDALGVTGTVITKLDGTAKGGMVVSISSSLSIQLKYIGIGEKIDDLREFDAEQFVTALF